MLPARVLRKSFSVSGCLLSDFFIVTLGSSFAMFLVIEPALYCTKTVPFFPIAFFLLSFQLCDFCEGKFDSVVPYRPLWLQGKTRNLFLRIFELGAMQVGVVSASNPVFRILPDEEVEEHLIAISERD